MNGGRNPLRGPFYELIQQVAPIFVFALLGVAVLAVVLNFLQDRSGPGSAKKVFDPVRNFRRINSAGMVQAVMGRPEDRPAPAKKKQVI